MSELVFWQRITSPHVVPLLGSLATLVPNVRLVAMSGMDPQRAALGWQIPKISRFKYDVAPDKASIATVLSDLEADAFHVVEGCGRQRWIRHVIGSLHLASAKWAAMMESVNDSGFLGGVKRAYYSLALRGPRAP